MSVSYRDGWVNVGGVTSHVLTWGGWIEDPLPPGGTILLFMCGIPGLTFFYKNFLEELHNRLKIPVWTISIAGHEIPPPNVVPKMLQDWSLYNNVRAQADHKMAFVKKYVPKDKKVIFVGHSFGGKMIMELLKDEELQNQTIKCFLLMPTLERFADLPRANFWRKMRKIGFVKVLSSTIWVLSSLPYYWRRKFAQWYFHNRRIENPDDYCMEAMIQMVSSTLIFRNICKLVEDEMTAITDLNKDVLTKISDRTKVFFAMDDFWAPLTHYHTLRVAVPQLHVEILGSEFEHAFTLKTSHEMADHIVAGLKT